MDKCLVFFLHDCRFLSWLPAPSSTAELWDSITADTVFVYLVRSRWPQLGLSWQTWSRISPTPPHRPACMQMTPSCDNLWPHHNNGQSWHGCSGGHCCAFIVLGSAAAVVTWPDVVISHCWSLPHQENNLQSFTDPWNDDVSSEFICVIFK